jgi:hypothetical protein
MYVQPVTEVDQVNAFGQVVERDLVAGALVVAPTVLVAPTVPAVEIDQVNAFGQVIERDFVAGTTPVPTLYAAPVVGAPAGPMVAEVDTVNAFGQVVERDLVTAPTALFTSYSTPAVSAPGVTEVDKVNALGQVVERDITVTGAPATRVIGGLASPYYGGFVSSYPTSTILGGVRTLPASIVLGAPAVTEVDRVNAFGQVVERDFIGGASRILPGSTTVLPPTTVVSGSYAPPVLPPTTSTSVLAPRVVSGSYTGFPSTTVVSGSYAPAVTEVDRVNAFGQVVERDFIGGASRVIGGLPYSTVVGGSRYVGGLPTSTVVGGLPTTAYYGAPAMTEVDKVNAFGQVVERDFIGRAPRVLSSYPSSTVVAGARTLPTTVLGASGVAEVDRVNAFGQVVERDFIGGAPRVVGGFPSTTVLGASTISRLPSTTVLGSRGLTEIDKVNAFGQVVERDFVGGASRVYSSPTTVLPPTTVYGGYGGFPSSTIVGAPGVTEVYNVNAFGQVVERDFVGAAPQLVGSVAPATLVGAPAVTEVDKVNALGQVVERDITVGVPTFIA